MSKLQRMVLLVGFCIISLMLLLPPWKYINLREGDNIERNAGYAAVFDPPSVKDHEAIKEAFSIPKTYDASLTNARSANNTTPTPTPDIRPIEIRESAYEVRPDFTRLLIQCCVVVFVTLGFIVFLQRPLNR